MFSRVRLRIPDQHAKINHLPSFSHVRALVAASCCFNPPSPQYPDPCVYTNNHSVVAYATKDFETWDYLGVALPLDSRKVSWLAGLRAHEAGHCSLAFPHINISNNTHGLPALLKHVNTRSLRGQAVRCLRSRNLSLTHSMSCANCRSADVYATSNPIIGLLS